MKISIGLFLCCYCLLRLLLLLLSILCTHTHYLCFAIFSLSKPCVSFTKQSSLVQAQRTRRQSRTHTHASGKQTEQYTQQAITILNAFSAIFVYMTVANANTNIENDRITVAIPITYISHECRWCVHIMPTILVYIQTDIHAFPSLQ